MTTRHIALLLFGTSSYDRNVARGVLSYGQTLARWEFIIEIDPYNPETFDRLHDVHRDIGLNGIIANLWHRTLLARVLEFGLPTVEVSGTFGPAVPTAHVDDAQVGALAARHLMEKGLTQLGFVGTSAAQHSLVRLRAFQAEAERSGCPCSCLDLSPTGQETYKASERREMITRWLQSLPKPVGVMGWYDLIAREIADACQRIDLDVPQDVAVVGAGDDEFLCTFNRLSLSSVDLDPARVGGQAARLLARLMSRRSTGGSDGSPTVLVQPKGVQTRRSSDIAVGVSPLVVDALRFIRDHSDRPLRVDDVLDNVPISRRFLELEFRRLLKRSPLQQIRQERIARVMHLLSQTTMSIKEIAETAGFDDTAALCHLFRKVTGQSPRSFRTTTRT